MAKKTPEEIFREAQAKMKLMGGAITDPQFQQDVVANAKALPEAVKQGAYNAGNQLGSTMEKSNANPLVNALGNSFPGSERFAPELFALSDGIRDTGTALRQGIYDVRTGGEPKAPYPDAYGLLNANANAINSNMMPPQMMESAGKLSAIENKIATEMEQLGIPVSQENIQMYIKMKQAAQGGMQSAQGAIQSGLDSARGLLQ